MDKFKEVQPTFKACARCGHVKPIYEFYENWGPGWGNEGKYTAYCKICTIEFSREHQALPSGVSNYKSETYVRDELRHQGIYAIYAKDGRGWQEGEELEVLRHRMNIIAWGCVRIRTLYSTLHERNGRFQWGLRSLPVWEVSHVVILVCDYGDSVTFHLFRPSHPIFYHPNGERKAAVSYKPDPTWIHSDLNTLTKDIMLEHKNRWSLIERIRLEISEDLRGE